RSIETKVSLRVRLGRRDEANPVRIVQILTAEEHFATRLEIDQLRESQHAGVVQIRRAQKCSVERTGKIAAFGNIVLLAGQRRNLAALEVERMPGAEQGMCQPGQLSV